MVGRLEGDVIDCARALDEVRRMMDTRPDREVSLEVKLYRTAPTMFLCHTDEVAFVQQYHFWTRRLSDTPVPVLEYRAKETNVPGYPMHRELREHFEFIWQHASVNLHNFLYEEETGPDPGIGRSGLVNAYTDRSAASRRIVYMLENAKREVLIQGISLKSFFGGDAAIPSVMFNLIAAGRVPIRVLLLNPGCLQAEYRGYR